MKKKVRKFLIVSLFLFAFLAFPLSLFAEDSPLNDITCPPSPSFSSCEAVCPEGYHPVSNPLNKGGFFTCVKDSKNAKTVSDLYDSCVYYNPKCEKEELNKVVSEYSTQKTGEALKQLLNRDGDLTFMEKLILLATFNFDVLKSKGIKDPRMAFFGNFFDFLNDKLYWLLLYYFVPVFIYAVSLFGLFKFSHFSEVSRDLASYFSGRLPEVSHPKIWALKLAFGAFLFLVPEGAPKVGGYSPPVNSAPLAVQVVRLSAFLGDALAQEVANGAIKAFTAFEIESAKKEMDEVNFYAHASLSYYKDLATFYENHLKECYSVYGKVNFLAPDSALSSLTPKSFEESKKYPWATPAKCREFQTKYKEAVIHYNTQLGALENDKEIAKELNLGEAVRKASEFAKQDLYTLGIFISKDPKDFYPLALALVVKANKDLGWPAFPMIGFPIMGLIQERLDLNKEFAKSLGVEQLSPSLISKIIAMVSFPPGNQIFSVLMKVGDKASEVLGNLLGFAGIAGKIKAVASLGIVGVVLFFTYVISSAILKFIPLLFLGIVFAVRILTWVVDLAKLTLASPFVFLNYVIFNRSQRGGEFLLKSFSVGAYPLALLVSAVLAFFASSVVDFVFYYPLSYALEALGKLGGLDVVKIGSISAGGSFVHVFIIAVLIYAQLLLKVYLIYKIVIDAPERFLEIAGFREGVSVSQSIKEIAEVAKRGTTPI